MLTSSINGRPMRLVYIHVDRPRVMDEQWIYFVDQSIMINRVSEFKNFYPDHPEQATTVLCAEVTAQTGCSVEDVVAELESLSILSSREVLDTRQIDLEKAYPVYDTRYEQNMEKAGEALKAYPNLFLLGRQAEFAHQDIDEIFGRAKAVAADCLQCTAGQSDG